MRTVKMSEKKVALTFAFVWKLCVYHEIVACFLRFAKMSNAC